jgi:hypothetical protein
VKKRRPSLQIILVPLAWHLPHDWNMSACGYAVAPIPPEEPLLNDYIEKR